MIARIKEHQQLLRYTQNHTSGVERDLKSMLDSWSGKKVDELISKRAICLHIYFSILNMGVQFEDENYDTIKVILLLLSFMILPRARS